MLFSTITALLSGRSVDISMVIAQVLSTLFIIFCILPLHEFAHGWMAKKLGDPTAKWEGRLTLNPIASIDPMGALFLLLFGFGWAKPVPVDSSYFKKPKTGMAIVAAAGPVSNLLASLVGALIYIPFIAFVTTANFFTIFIANFLSAYITINISLAVFNLLPVPPLDGSRIVGAFLSDKALYNYYRYQNIITMIMFFLIMFGALSGPLAIAQNFFANIILNIAKFPYQIFGAI